jgi:cell division protein FtsI/penicillin-binding protein 2
MGEKIEDWLVITTLVEDGGEGSQVAAPIAYEIVARALK